MNTQPIKQALEGYNKRGDDLKTFVHYSEYIRRMGPHWLHQLIDERELMVAQLKRIEGVVIPGLAMAIASETLKQIGEGEPHVETTA